MASRVDAWVRGVSVLAVAFSASLIAASAAGAAIPVRIDRSFGQEGIADEALEPHYQPVVFRKVETLPDGKIQATREVFMGDGSTIRRYEPDGSPDPTFPPQPAPPPSSPPLPQESVPFTIQQAAELGDGSIIAAGDEFYGVASKVGPPLYEVAVARFTPEGKLDQSFGKGGIVRLRTDVGLAAPLLRGLILDGEEVMIGADAAPGDNIDPFLAKLTATGSLDPSFGDGGVVHPRSSILDFRQLPGGELLVAGTHTVSSAPCCSVKGGSSFSLSRYTANGQLDSGFGAGGVATAQFAGSAIAHAIRWEDDGSVLIGGGAVPPTAICAVLSQCEELPALGRFTPSGQLDPSFGNGGLLELDRLRMPGTVFSISDVTGVQALAGGPSGGTIAAGGSGVDGFLASLSQGGNLEAGFGDAGLVTERYPRPSIAEAEAVATDPRGHILVAGRSDAGRPSPVPGGVLVRYTTKGRLDPTFGNGAGYLALPTWPQQIATDRAGRTVVLGGAVLTRVTGDGRLDPSFGREGFVRLGFVAEAMAVLPDGSILAAGGQANQSGSGMMICQLRPNGKLDRSFGRKGKVRIGLGEPRLSGIEAVTVQKDGRILLAGFVRHAPKNPHPMAFAAMRLLPSGAIDRGFGRKGRVTPKIEANSKATDVTTQDGRILLAGWLNRHGRVTDLVLAYNQVGKLDRRFGSGGIARAGNRSAHGESFPWESIAVLPTTHRILVLRPGMAQPLASLSLAGRRQPSFARHVKVAPDRIENSYTPGPRATLQKGSPILAWTTPRANGQGGLASRIALQRLLVR